MSFPAAMKRPARAHIEKEGNPTGFGNLAGGEAQLVALCVGCADRAHALHVAP